MTLRIFGGSIEIMKNEFEKHLKIFKEKYPKFLESYDDEIVFENGWNEARDKILEILKQETFYSREEGDIISVDVIKKIENL